jgi:cell division protein ZipA
MELHSILVLVTILAVIFSLIYFINTRQKKWVRQMTGKQEPRFDIVTPPAPATEYEPNDRDDLEHHNHTEDTHLLLDDPLLQPKAPVKKVTIQAAPKKTPTGEEVICLVLVAKPNKPYAGYELLQSLLAAGLRFGAMNIFHRHEDVNGKGKILFSVASASEPGTFEINKMGAFSGKALMMFLRLSSHKDLMLAFDTMLETAKQLIEDLDGDILDSERKILSTDKIEKIRKKIVDFEQKQLIGDLFDQ